MLPNFEEINSSLRIIALPMRTKFRGIQLRETAIFQGPYGWGEFAPFTEYDDAESALWLQSAIEAAYQPRPQLLREVISINGTIPATDSKAEIDSLISSYSGARVFKIKVGTTLSADVARIQMVKNSVPDSKIRIDVNGAWNVDEAIEKIRAISDVVGESEIEYVEQPVSSLSELKELKSRLDRDIKIAGDEILRKSANPLELDLHGAVDILVLKVSPLGGITRSLMLAGHFGLPVVVSSALESAIGINYGLTLAAALPHLDYACGLATSTLFEKDIAQLPIINGEMRVSTLEIESLERFTAPHERLEWWRNRIRRTLELMQ